MITNPRRRKQIEYFVDRDHPVMHEYYDLLDKRLSRSRLRKEMERLIKSDPLFFDPYIVVADLLLDEGRVDEARALITQAYQKAMLLIIDKNGNWPKVMEWGWLENRHLMRTIDRYAYMLWEEGKAEEALDIFRRLLRANPRDNQGARFSILAIRLGLGPDWEKPFMVKEGPLAGQALEAAKVWKWFDKNAKQFPDEFDWLFEEWKKEEH